MKSTKKHISRTSRKASATYDVDIAQEFKDVKATFSNRLDKIEAKLDEWKTVFDRQLTELNFNMKNVMDKIAQHEFRLTEHDQRIKCLEDGSIKIETRKKTMSEAKGFMWLVAKAALLVGVIIGSAGGLKLIWSLSSLAR